MSASRLRLVALAVAVAQIAVLGWMIVDRALLLRNGTPVMLAVRPVDPRDLLRGDYVRLGYDISSLPVGLFGPDLRDVDRGETAVFVRLRRGEDGLWKPVAARFGRAPEGAPASGEVDIRGVTDVFPSPDAQFISVDYGIERFYLPEGEGRALQDAMGERPFRMEVAVGEGGRAQIKGFYDGDRLVYAEPVY